MKLLLVEDNEPDARLIREMLKEAPLGAIELRLADRLDQALGDIELEKPEVVLLDLNMPRMDGREVLAEIKKDQNLRRIPVVVLTTSKAEEDIIRSYDLHANAYVTKPVGLAEFLKVIQSIEQFWMEIVKLP